MASLIGTLMYDTKGNPLHRMDGAKRMGERRREREREGEREREREGEREQNNSAAQLLQQVSSSSFVGSLPKRQFPGLEPRHYVMLRRQQILCSARVLHPP